jgi:hypothetical protein
MPAQIASQPHPESAQPAARQEATSLSQVCPCSLAVKTLLMPKMTPGTSRIPAVPVSQRPQQDLVEALGSCPCRILRRQQTLLVLFSPAFPIPWKVFPLEKFSPGKFSPGKFPLESF